MLNKGVLHFLVHPSSLLRFLRRNLCSLTVQFLRQVREKETSKSCGRIELYQPCRSQRGTRVMCALNELKCNSVSLRGANSYSARIVSNIRRNQFDGLRSNLYPAKRNLRRNAIESRTGKTSDSTEMQQSDKDIVNKRIGSKTHRKMFLKNFHTFIENL